MRGSQALPFLPTRKKSCNARRHTGAKLKYGTHLCFAVRLRADIRSREELEREQKALEEDDCRGLGLKGGNWHGEVNWYGGRVQQLVYLRESQGEFRLELGPMQKVGRSHRISRFLGSRRLLQVKLPDGVMYEAKSVRTIHELLSKKFVLCGRVFVPFAIKDGKTYFVETDEDFERTSCIDQCDHLRLPFALFIEWYNPLELNKTQVCSAVQVFTLLI